MKIHVNRGAKKRQHRALPTKHPQAALRMQACTLHAVNIISPSVLAQQKFKEAKEKKT